MVVLHQEVEGLEWNILLVLVLVFVFVFECSMFPNSALRLFVTPRSHAGPPKSDAASGSPLRIGWGEGPGVRCFPLSALPTPIS